MKLLRNPVVVGVLAVAAIALVIHSVYKQLPSRPRRGPVATAPTPTASPAVTKLEKAAPSSPSTGSPSSPPVDVAPGQMALGIIHEDAPRWAQGRRDPFQVRAIAAHPIYPPARDVLSLSAVWRQTDSSLAVLNQRIYAAGDSILRYTIKSIEPDRVWVQGPNGRESVEFKSAQTTLTNLQQTPAALGARVGPPDQP